MAINKNNAVETSNAGKIMQTSGFNAHFVC